PSLYKKVSQEIATEPEKIVHIGDSLKNDYEPAEEAGMNPYLIDREKVEVKKSSGLHVLNDLRELSESPTL
ncbi:MAG: HAD hydrolase-like protein, partial [Candidatus Natronoplasma sp.]